VIGFCPLIAVTMEVVMFESRPSELRRFLRNIFGFGTLAGVTLETYEHLAEGRFDSLAAAVPIAFTLFLVFWVLDVLKEAADKVAEESGKKEEKTFAATQRLSLRFSPRPGLADFQAVQFKLSEILRARYPASGTAKVIAVDSESSFFRLDIKKGITSAASILVRFDGEGRTPSLQQAVTPKAETLPGNLQITITRRSRCAQSSRRS
jgi:hypothetical protein